MNKAYLYTLIYTIVFIAISIALKIFWFKSLWTLSLTFGAVMVYMSSGTIFYLLAKAIAEDQDEA